MVYIVWLVHITKVFLFSRTNKYRFSKEVCPNLFLWYNYIYVSTGHNPHYTDLTWDTQGFEKISVSLRDGGKKKNLFPLFFHPFIKCGCVCGMVLHVFSFLIIFLHVHVKYIVVTSPPSLCSYKTQILYHLCCHVLSAAMFFSSPQPKLCLLFWSPYLWVMVPQKLLLMTSVAGIN